MDMIEYSFGRARCLSRKSNENIDYMNRLLQGRNLAATPVCFPLQDGQNVVRVTLHEYTEAFLTVANKVILHWAWDQARTRYTCLSLSVQSVYYLPVICY